MRSYSRFTIIGTTTEAPTKMFAASGKELNCTTIKVAVPHGGDKTSIFACEAWNETQACLANIHANQQVLISGSIKINTFQTSRGSAFSRTVLYLDDVQPIASGKASTPASQQNLPLDVQQNPPARSYRDNGQEAEEDYPF